MQFCTRKKKYFMEELDKIIDAKEIRKRANSYDNSIAGYCNWFNNLVKNKRNNLSKKEKVNHTIDVDLDYIIDELYERSPNRPGWQLKHRFVTKLEQAGWKAFYNYYQQTAFPIPYFFWDSSFKKDSNINYEIITANEMIPYEYQPSKDALMKDENCNKNRSFPYTYSSDHTLLENFSLWFNNLTAYKQSNQSSKEKLCNYYEIKFTDIPSYFLTSNGQLLLPITIYLEKFHWSVTYDGLRPIIHFNY